MSASNLATSEFDVFFNYRYIRYAEGQCSLDLPIDPPDDGAAPAIVDLPGEVRWAAEMPEWARDRREPIVQRIQNSCTHMRCKWEEY